MAQPYVGEIRMFGGNFPPAGWMFCEGQILPISENETLFQLIGTTYGGDGQETFAVPDLRGRLSMHWGPGYMLAETGGAEQVTLTVQQIASHSHAVMAAVPPAGAISASSPSPVNNLPAQGATKIYAAPTVAPTAAMNAAVVTAAGGAQPHENMMPYLCVSYIISLFGIFPSPT